MDGNVELRNTTKIFGEITAVDNVSLKVRRGEFFSLLGPSGCGKTTTLRLIAGFEEPTRGDILINNENVRDKRPYERNVNTVFQSYALFPHLTVFDNIRFGLARRKTPRRQAGELVEYALDLVQLAGMGDRYPRQLSGGQQQRVALARALVLKPEVLLLDEPLGALDLKLRKQMQLELKSLQEKVGITFIYVTHDQEEALIMSDRIAVMDHGAIVQVGTPEEIYEFPMTRFVADFIGVSNFFTGFVTDVKQADLRVRTEGGLSVAVPLTGSQANGRPICFSVRPERFFLENHGNGLDCENQFAGTIIGKMYSGNSIHYTVSLSAQEVVTILLKNDSKCNNQTIFSVGDSVCVSWYRDDSVVLKG